MTETILAVNDRIAQRVSELRTLQKLSLDALANRTGVSRSMISLIERGESSPTAVVLEKLSAGLGVTLASLFEDPAAVHTQPVGPISRRRDQMEWKDPVSGYVRRNVSPSGDAFPMQIAEIRFPAGARIAFESGARDVRVYQHVWMLEGTMEITTGADTHRLREGDCLAMQLDRPTMFYNPTRKAARYAVVIASSSPSGR